MDKDKEKETLFTIAKILKNYCNNTECEDCPFIDKNTNNCVIDDSSPAYWKMD